MRIMYVCVWMRLSRIESKFAGFTFNVLLHSHSCGQVLYVSHVFDMYRISLQKWETSYHLNNASL